jgi:hypothetical protein
MAEPSGRERHRPPSGKVEASRGDVDAERLLGRTVGMGLPFVVVISAVGIGFGLGVGPALLVLAFGALVGTIALLWASLRTLSGDAPLPAGLERAASHSQGGVSGVGERKRRVLRALKDLESEHAIGKIDDADYEAIASRYRDEAKAVMRELDEEAAPMRAEAERLANEYVALRGRGAKAGDPRPRPAAKAERVVCASCATSNEPDATFCKQCGRSLSAGEGTANAAN